MRIEHKVAGANLVVRITGNLDLATAADLRQSIEQMMEQARTQNLYLDLAGVNFIDSSGLGVILGRYRRVTQFGGKMGLINPTAHARRVLEMAGVLRLMPVFDSETRALAGR